MNDNKRDLAKITLGVLFIGILIISTLWVLQPFLPALVWATMISIATWPLMLRLQRLLWNRRLPTTLLMMLVLLLLFVIPLLMALATFAEKVPQLLDWAGQLSNTTPPELLWLQDIPLIGDRLFELWQQVLASGGQLLFAKATPYLGLVAKWLAAQAGNLGMVIVHFLLTVVVCGLLYYSGEQASYGIRRFAHRLAGKRGDQATQLATQAIRAVAMGVVVTALVQSLIAGIGLMIAGIPYVMLLTLLMFILAIAQIGAVPVLVCSVLYLYWSGDTTWATFLLVWTLVVGSMDNILRPLLIRQGADLPLILILSGVIGGLLAFGIIGLFIGPVVLAVAYTLLDAWIREGELREAQRQSEITDTPR
ncbi:Predicted PurR-regulated permease PerM [Aeromonas sp. RU39B]|jgi:predicted PurR-regulated permease PerM|uniref:AI-2E family transporter YdiK n=1 Tax=Aeromonas sp. RU39B TaxID=1907416 RepID=UPI000954B537|nr:AI-2E family transporter YdiK [Aeromonas sp. RU39B]SIR60458.1 Predicted PurR-regulated permease PerM [Aeromonas sp. RU39B]